GTPRARSASHRGCGEYSLGRALARGATRRDARAGARSANSGSDHRRGLPADPARDFAWGLACRDPHHAPALGRAADPDLDFALARRGRAARRRARSARRSARRSFARRPNSRGGGGAPPHSRPRTPPAPPQATPSLAPWAAAPVGTALQRARAASGSLHSRCTYAAGTYAAD